MVMRRLLLAMVIGLAAAGRIGGARSDDAQAPPESNPVPPPPEFTPVPPPADTSLVFLIENGSRLYPDWKEEHRVRLNQSFHIGDTQFQATIAAFFPDFKIVDKKPINASLQMNNPAAHVYVRSDSGAVDSTWAFLNFPPHFSPRSFFTFRLKEVLGYADSAASPPAQEN